MKKTAVAWIVVILMSIVVERRVTASTVTPAITDTTLLAFRGGTITLQGENLFQENISLRRHKVILKSSQRHHRKVVIRGNAETASAWDATAITVALPDFIDSTYAAMVKIGNQKSNAVPLAVYEYNSFHVPNPPNPEGPLDIAFDVKRNLIWMIPEFHTRLYSFDAVSGAARAYGIPLPSRSIFRGVLYGHEGGTNISVLGEDVDVAPNGDIWFTQGGYWLYGGDYYNASRVVRYRPDTEEWQCFNIPINDAEVVGVLIEKSGARVWVTAGGFRVNSVMSFLPDTFVPEDTSCLFDFTSPAFVGFCSGNDEERCFREYPVSSVDATLSHLAEDSSGAIWFTELTFTNAIGVIDPISGIVTEYAMPPPRTHFVYNDRALGSAPWQMEIDTNEVLWITAYLDSTIIAFDTKTKGIEKYDLPVDTTKEATHSLTIDTMSNIWFTVPGIPGRIGRITNGQIQMFAPLSELSNDTPTIVGWPTGPQPNGITVNPQNGDVWFADYTHESVGRLKRF